MAFDPDDKHGSPDGRDTDRFDLDFGLEASSHEPDEYDPEAAQHDPDAPGLTIPTVETDETDVPTDLLRTFWLIVIVVNVAIFAIALGTMLIGFRGRTDVGVPLIVGSIVLLGLAYRRYRRFRANDPEWDA